MEEKKEHELPETLHIHQPEHFVFISPVEDFVICQVLMFPNNHDPIFTQSCSGRTRLGSRKMSVAVDFSSVCES